jgi:hypothetical protein
MPGEKPLSNYLGLDIGKINTRAAFFGVSERKFRLQGYGIAPTSLGSGMHPASGAGRAVQVLQEKTGIVLVKPSGGIASTMDSMRQNIDQVGLVTSVGPRLKTAVFGLSAQGSLNVGRVLAESLPLCLSGLFGLADLGDESGVIDALITIQPDLLIITGGEDGSAEAHIIRWVELARTLCLLLPAPSRPMVLYAGDSAYHEMVHRRLEPVCQVLIAPNLQPEYGEMDLVPAQAVLDPEILKRWWKQMPGLGDLATLPNSKAATVPFALGRIVRYLSQAKATHPVTALKSGVLAVDLGGHSTMLLAGMDGRAGTVVQPCWEGFSTSQDEALISEVQKWTAQPVPLPAIQKYLSNYVVRPDVIPESLDDLAILQAWARVRMQQSLKRLAMNYNWLPYQPGQGLTAHFEPIIASGSVLTQAPTPGQAMLMLLDGLQPRNVTTIVLDTYHLLPQMGLVGEIAPILPVHVLESDAFTNLGTVIVAVSDVPAGETLLTANVKMETGKDYAVSIPQGTLRRLVVPKGVSVVLELEPRHHTDIGFGGPGLGGRLKVPSGVLGVVIDARGRPLRLPSDAETRAAQLTRWLWNLGG